MYFGYFSDAMGYARFLKKGSVGNENLLRDY